MFCVYSVPGRASYVAGFSTRGPAIWILNLPNAPYTHSRKTITMSIVGLCVPGHSNPSTFEGAEL